MFNIKKIIFLISILFFVNGVSKASLLWNLQDGVEEYNKRNFEISKNFFINYINDNPNDKDGYYWLAKTYQNIKKENKKAIDYFQKSYDLTMQDDELEQILLNKNSALKTNIEDYFDMATMYFETNKLSQADYYADMMLKLDPKSASAYFVKSKIAFVKENKDLAREYIKKAIIFNPSIIGTNLAKALEVVSVPNMDEKTYKILATEAYFKGEIYLSIEYCKKILEINPTDITYINFLTDLYIKNNDLEIAKNFVNSSISIFKNDVKLRLNQAKIYGLSGQIRQQETSLKEAYEINPNEQNVLLDLGNFYLKQKDYKSAKKYFKNLTEVNSSMYEAYFGYIYSLIQTGENKEVLQLIRKAKTLNKNPLELQYLLALYCESIGEFSQAKEYLQLISNIQDNPRYFLETAKINYYENNFKASISNLDDAKDDLYNDEIKEEIEEFYIKNYIKDENLEALKEFNKDKLILDKNRLIYKYNLYIMYKLQGDAKKAQLQKSLVRKKKVVSIQDYIDSAEIDLLENNPNSAIKTLDKAIKKFNEYSLYLEKLKVYYHIKDENNIQKTIIQMNNVLN